MGTTCLSGCLGAGGSIDYDPAIRNDPGTMTVDVAQTYSRERLINERAADVAWIDRLIAASEDPTKVTFKPTLLREMEQISAFSATLGVKYDPTAGLNYKRSNETGEIMQEIDVLKAKVALAQVKRDIELIEARMPTQTDPVNASLGALGTGGAVPAASSGTAPDASTVAAAVNTLIASATARLDAEAKPIASTAVVSSPADDFKDRLAYRNMLKAARNAAGLDDLHDAGDNRLVRLNLHATVIPDPRNPRALGALQVKVAPDGIDTVPKYFADWLASVNKSSEWRVDAGTFKPNGTLDELKDSGDFQESKVGTLRLLIPVLETQRGDKLDSDALIHRADWGNKDDADSVKFSTATSDLPPDGSDAATVAASVCAPGTTASLYLAIADARVKSETLIRLANLTADKLTEAPPGVDVAAKVARAKLYQDQVLNLIHDIPACADLERYSPIPTKWRLLSRREFRGSQQVRVYEVGPREQAQQVSTVARSAQSLAMAVSLAAAAPSAGVAGNLGAGFRRDIMNRASTLDRVPEVVGYSVGGNQTFGWVIGPHATTDSKGRAMVRQEPKGFDLTVDLSIPAWWGALELKVTRVWAPSPQALVDGALNIDGREPVTIPVELTSGAADYNAFTQFLIRDSKRPVSLDEVIGGPVNGCAATTLFLKGDNVWRAEKVLLLGVPLGRDAFTIAPDMRGLVVTVPAVAAIPGESAYKLDDQIHLLTSLGEAKRKFEYNATLSGDGCKAKAPAADPAAAGDTVTIMNAGPVSFTVPSLIRIDIDGTNLGKVDLVKLSGRTWIVTNPAPDGTGFTAEFSRDITEGIDEGDAKLEFFAKKKPVGTAQAIRINRN